MLLCTVFFCVLNAYFVLNAHGPKYNDLNFGRVWPRPQMQIKHKALYTYDPLVLEVNITNESCAILTEAINRCIFNMKSLQKLLENYTNISEVQNCNVSFIEPIQKLQVELTNECEEYPQFGMEEAYILIVSSISKLKSSSIWGIIRGLETFSQLFFITTDHTKICVHKTEIHDFPRYSHRGLLINTSRYFLSLSSIFMTIKALAINKMNVLHWHMTDDQSFSYKSEVLPELSRQGAFQSSMVYTKRDIQTVIDYARYRGIRVIPEFDVPTHTRSWGRAFPKIITECDNNTSETLGIMNPINDTTYKLVWRLLNEVQNVFQDKYFHLGGDEINFSCWESNPMISKYMKDQDLQSSDLLAMFFLNIIPMLKNNKSPIVWEDVFENGVPLHLDTIVQVRKGDGEQMVRPMIQGYQVLYSTKWYLDQPYTFDDFYRTDPLKIVTNITDVAWISKLAIGGEACMWGENVDDENFFIQVWPRTCAVAERLWSDAEAHNFYTIPAEVTTRLNEQICRMIRRGITLNSLVENAACVV